MDFTEAERQRQQLNSRMQRGQIMQTAYIDAINTLRVTDSSGRIWQPTLGGNGWLGWNGTAWQPGTPPVKVDQYSVAQPRVQDATPERAKNFNEFRSQLITIDEFKRVSKEVPLSKRPQRWWDLLSILGGIAAAVIWSLYAVIRSGQEGFDFITPLLMIGIPVILVWFRADIDEKLIPIQKYRKSVSRIVLIGLGIAVPFLTAWILYNILHIVNYPLMWANIIVGPLVAYAIVRDPILAQGYAHEGRRVSPATISIIFFVLLISLIVIPVMADHCTADPLNAQDCLRSSGFAELLAGTFGVVLGALVNGPIIIQGITQGGAGAGAVSLPSDHAVVDLNQLGEKETTSLGDSEAGYPIVNKGDDAKALRRDYWERQRDISLEEVKRFNEDAKNYEMLKNIAEVVKFGCDKTIDILEQLTGSEPGIGPGWWIARSYTMLSDIGGGVGEAWVDPDNTSLYLARGGTKGLIDVEADVANSMLFDRIGILKDVDMTKGLLKDAFGNAAKGWIKGWPKEILFDGIHEKDFWGVDWNLSLHYKLNGVKDYVDKLGYVDNIGR